MADTPYPAMLYGLINIPPWVKFLAFAVVACFAAKLVMDIFQSKRETSSENNNSGNRRGKVLTAALLAVGAFVFLFLGVHDVTRSSDDPGFDVTQVQMQDTFIGSDIVFCVANVDADVSVDLPWYKAALINSSNVKFNALGRFPVGIDRFSEYWSQTRTSGPSGTIWTPSGKKKTYTISVTVPSPEIIQRYDGGVLYTEDSSDMTPAEAEKAYDVAYKSCRGTSKFHDASGGGLLTRFKKVFASGSSEYDKARDKAVKIARQRAEDPNDKSFGGMSAMEQAQENTRQKVQDLIRAAAQDEIAKLEQQGFVVLVVVNFDDTRKLDEPKPQAEPSAFQVASG